MAGSNGAGYQLAAWRWRNNGAGGQLTLWQSGSAWLSANGLGWRMAAASGVMAMKAGGWRKRGMAAGWQASSAGAAGAGMAAIWQPIWHQQSA